jgi:uncharacterized membrane protein
MEKSPLKFFLKYFFRGLLYTVPLTLTIYIIVQLFLFLDDLIPVEFQIPGLGVLILIGLITGLGFIGSSIIIQPIKSYFNKLMDRVPMLKTVYSSIKDLLSAFVGQKKSFTKPVLVKLNKDSNLEKLGFVTSTDLSKLGISGNKIAVYLPHSYNFSGNLFIVDASQVTPIENVKSADFMKFIVSGGVTDID